ncbi:MAG: MotA/TolQ/ExbB proton channel family protein [Oscillospiraceae bacterium]|nr:MotA/TolQ/ExbB proton channel family protein [Oscillospiraceae bacterium]
MDVFTPIALLVSLATIVVGILFLGGSMVDYLDLASALLVVVPTFGSLFAAFPIGQMLRTFKHFRIVLGMQKFDPVEYVEIISNLAEKARTQGLLVLESEAEKVEDDFVKKAAMMVADAEEAEVVEARLMGIIDATTARHAESWAIYDKGAALAPAFGMVGTLVGLINMLMNLDFSDAGGVSSLGMNMSAAMITTLYGSMFANLWFAPLGTKLRARHQIEIECKEIVVAGILAIQRGVNPRVVKEMLMEQIDPNVKIKAAKAEDD